MKEYLGLSSQEASKKLAKFGKNTLGNHKKKSALAMFLRQFTDIMILILIACTALSAFMGDRIEAGVMMGIVIMNAILGFIQEFRTEKTLEALRKMTALKARVLRDGAEVHINAEEIVPDDIVLLRSGDVVPADGFLLNSNSLTLDESMLTGESEAVCKEEGSVYSGTLCVSGWGTVKITATGSKTEMGKISGMIANVSDTQTPLQKKLANLGKIIVFLCILVCSGVTLAGVIKGEPLLDMLLTGISLAVAAVPEGLPAIITISLALGVQRMSGENALVRKLPAVETLGSTNIICSDKTGTLTQNKMTVRTIVTPSIILSGKGFPNDMDRIRDICILCNNNGDATEKALSSFWKDHEVPSYIRTGEIPFDSKRKCMSVILRDRFNSPCIFTKGGAEVILKKCSFYLQNGKIKSLDKESRKKLENYNDFLAGKALRVLGFALKQNSSEEKDMVFAGFAGLLDPPRPEATAAVAECHRAGIKTVMITGDHKITAFAIAKELGIPALDPERDVITGEEIDKMNDAQLLKASSEASVYARVMPAHKLRIVQTLKKAGNVVAMTGDGVNDAPAVKEADIGIAMGINGVDVTKEASAMILMDDNFATIVKAVRQGRGIYSNIKKFIRYMLSCNLGEIVTMFASVLFALPLPLLPIQILWVNLATDGLPGIALGLDPLDGDIMTKKPVPLSEGIFTKKFTFHIIFRGLLTGFCTLGAFFLSLYIGLGLDAARTTAFVTLILIQLVHSFECRSLDKSIFEIDLRENLYLVAADALSFLMMLAVVYIPFLQPIFHTCGLGWLSWGIILGFTMIGPILAGIIRPKN